MLSCCANTQKWPVQAITPEEEKNLQDLFDLPVPEFQDEKISFTDLMKAKEEILGIKNKYNLGGLVDQMGESSDSINQDLGYVSEVLSSKGKDTEQDIVLKAEQYEDMKIVIDEIIQQVSSSQNYVENENIIVTQIDQIQEPLSEKIEAIQVVTETPVNIESVDIHQVQQKPLLQSSMPVIYEIQPPAQQIQQQEQKEVISLIQIKQEYEQTEINNLTDIMVPVEMRKHEFQLKKSGYSLPPTAVVELTQSNKVIISQERVQIQPFPGVIKPVIQHTSSPSLKQPAKVKSPQPKKSPIVKKSMSEVESKLQEAEIQQQLALSGLEEHSDKQQDMKENQSNPSQSTSLQLTESTALISAQTQTVTFSTIKLLATPSNLLGYVNAEEIFSIPLITLKIVFNDKKREIRIQKYKILSSNSQEYEKRKSRLIALQQRTDQPTPVLRIDLQNQKITLISKNEALSYAFDQILFKEYIGVKSFLRMRACGVEFAYQGNESQVRLLKEKISVGGGKEWN
ncbi:hypothetical protein SS50377_26555 [Spironucleus salmonicida]|uniref:Uncharacterized protein n=1 Tax=Spironucleus salmonicida TaxID=348837 RepID=V6LL52_9EUKA|nr:hypothetical protein SS50377_26555 [Spironucleus salmonicida]|eukprot:EST41409.1 Hypothetical protein SS50377_19126 [Spironucleus salmonicida]